MEIQTFLCRRIESRRICRSSDFDCTTESCAVISYRSPAETTSRALTVAEQRINASTKPKRKPVMAGNPIDAARRPNIVRRPAWFSDRMIGFLSESPLSFEVMFHSGSYLFEITQRQLLIDGLCRFERMGLELFESHFDEVSLRNQRFVRLVMFVQRPVVEQNFMLQFLVGDALQPDRGERIAEETACGFEYGVGIADQVDELCIGIQLEQGLIRPVWGGFC